MYKNTCIKYVMLHENKYIFENIFLLFLDAFM